MHRAFIGKLIVLFQFGKNKKKMFNSMTSLSLHSVYFINPIQVEGDQRVCVCRNVGPRWWYFFILMV